MKEKLLGFRGSVDDLIKRRLKDKHGRRCPKDLVKQLRAAAVEDFSTRPSEGLDWDMLRGDVEMLRTRLGKPKG